MIEVGKQYTVGATTVTVRQIVPGVFCDDVRYKLGNALRMCSVATFTKWLAGTGELPTGRRKVKARKVMQTKGRAK